MKVLIVEDDIIQADFMKLLLDSNGFTAECVSDDRSGESFTGLGIYDLVIVDAAASEMNGCEIAKMIRDDHFSMPILMLTEKSEAEDRITGLNAGADYCLAKPFDDRELLASVNALLRRQGGQIYEMQYGDVKLDLSTCFLSCGDRKVRLSGREFELMRYLLESGERNTAKHNLLIRIWGYGSGATENYVEVYVGFLRKKLKSIDSKVSIKALRRLGYHLEMEKEA